MHSMRDMTTYAQATYEQGLVSLGISPTELKTQRDVYMATVVAYILQEVHKAATVVLYTLAIAQQELQKQLLLEAKQAEDEYNLENLKKRQISVPQDQAVHIQQLQQQIDQLKKSLEIKEKDLESYSKKLHEIEQKIKTEIPQQQAEDWKNLLHKQEQDLLSKIEKWLKNNPNHPNREEVEDIYDRLNKANKNAESSFNEALWEGLKNGDTNAVTKIQKTFVQRELLIAANLSKLAKSGVITDAEAKEYRAENKKTLKNQKEKLEKLIEQRDEIQDNIDDVKAEIGHISSRLKTTIGKLVFNAKSAEEASTALGKMLDSKVKEAEEKEEYKASGPKHTPPR